MRIDVHVHAIPAEFLDWVRCHPEKAQAELVCDSSIPGGHRLCHRQGYSYPVVDSFWHNDARWEQLSAAGIQAAVLSPAPSLFYYWLDREQASEIARRVNDGMAATVAEDSRCLAGLATLPMVDPVAAAEELHRAVRELGLRGALIGTDVEGISLTDSRFSPVWQVAEELKTVLFLHPYYVGHKERLGAYYLTNLLGNPWSTTLAAAELTLSGFLDNYSHLRLVLAHGGGFLPYQIGRMNHGYIVRPETSARARHSPEEYLRRYYYDSIIFHPKALAFLLELVGADRVLLGSDFPFDMADWPPWSSLVSALPESDDRRIAVEAGNALALFGIQPHDDVSPKHPQLSDRQGTGDVD